MGGRSAVQRCGGVRLAVVSADCGGATHNVARLTSNLLHVWLQQVSAGQAGHQLVRVWLPLHALLRCATVRNTQRHRVLLSTAPRCALVILS